MPKMRREEKLDLILLCRYLERKAGSRYGVRYSRNVGADPDTIKFHCRRSRYLLDSKYKPFREGVIYYSKGWGWRVRKDWREVVKAIECTNSRIYTPNA